MSSIGNFSESGKEYIIRKAQLKRPMVNYFWNRFLSSTRTNSSIPA